MFPRALELDPDPFVVGGKVGASFFLKPDLREPRFAFSCPGVQTQLQELRHRGSLPRLWGSSKTRNWLVESLSLSERMTSCWRRSGEEELRG